MSISGIQGHLLEVTVVGCNKLKDTEWISRQDPYVCLDYATSKFRTRTCTDGGKNPIFQEKFVFTLIEGLREIQVTVWNSNTLLYDDFIGSGKIQINDVLSRGFDDRAWPLQTKTGRYAGEVKLILHYANASKPVTSYTPTAPPYISSARPHNTPTGPPNIASSRPHISMYSAPPPVSSFPPNPTSTYQPCSSTTYPPPPSTTYPPLPKSQDITNSPYPYPPYPYPPPPDQTPYPPPAYQPPPSVYPPQPYPPPSHGVPYGGYSGQYPAVYPPPPH